jgi:1,4-dihydroxy-2-naphthoyl-CoA synthase
MGFISRGGGMAEKIRGAAGSGASSPERPCAQAAELTRKLRERPYAVLGVAAVTGYLLGGGLFSRVTRPLVRMALGALVVPRLQSWAARAIQGFGRRLADEPRQAHYS